MAKERRALLRGVRGATTVDQDSAEEILQRTAELLQRMAEANDADPDRMAAILFSLTPDLHAAFPAAAARRLGWKYVALMCMRELDVPEGLPKTVRVLMFLDTDRAPQDLRHVYLRGARELRTDLDPVGDG